MLGSFLPYTYKRLSLRLADSGVECAINRFNSEGGRRAPHELTRILSWGAVSAVKSAARSPCRLIKVHKSA